MTTVVINSVPQFGDDLAPDLGWSIRTSEFRDGMLSGDSFDMQITDEYPEFAAEARRVASEFTKASDEFGFFQFAAKVWHSLCQIPVGGSIVIPDPFVTLNDDGTIQTVTYLIEGK